MTPNLFSSLLSQFEKLSEAFPTMLMLVLALYLIYFVDRYIFRRKLSRFGVRPRTKKGLIGIPISFLFHANFNHIFFNSIPLLVLGTFILAPGWGYLFIVTLLVGIGESTIVWLIGRPGNHIGISGIIMGFFGYVLMHAYLQPSVSTVMLAIVALYYFGSILFSVIPQGAGMSWESHLFGLLIGIGVGYLDLYYSIPVLFDYYFDLPSAFKPYDDGISWFPSNE